MFADNSQGRLLFTSLVAVLICCGGTAIAATAPQSVTDLTGNSTHIIRAEVLGQESFWNDAHNVIYTLITLKVNELHKGTLDPSANIQIWVPGGQVADTGLSVEHAAQFQDGQDVLLFLVQRDKYFDVTSWEMGKFTVVNNRVAEKNTSVTEFINQIKAAQR